MALTTRPRNIENANEIVFKCLEIIEYLTPKYYIIENPQTGLLKGQSFMNGIPYIDIDYCKYNMPYRKRTRIWSNIEWIAKPLCSKDCNYMNGNRHLRTTQKGNNKKYKADRNYEQNNLYVIPSELIMDIFKGVV
jgi:hypothetical protein